MVVLKQTCFFHLTICNNMKSAEVVSLLLVYKSNKIVSIFLPVFEHGLSVHADIQLDMYDAPHRTLVWLPPVSCAYAPRVPF